MTIHIRSYHPAEKKWPQIKFVATNQIWRCQGLSEVSHLSVKRKKHVFQPEVECSGFSRYPSRVKIQATWWNNGEIE